MIRVLVIEDNGADAEMLAEAFDETNAEVHCSVVADPKGCVARVASETWDLILMDLRLGPHDGHILLEKLQAMGTLSKTRTFVLSSSSAPEDIEKAWRHDIHGYLRKPFTIEGWWELADRLVAESGLAGDHAD